MAQTQAGLDYQALLASIVDSTDDAIVSKDVNGIVTSWNGGAERIFGFSAEEMIGGPIMRLIPPDRQGEEQNILDSIRAGRRVDTFSSMRMRKDGSQVPVSVTISPIIGRDGVIVGASKIARDISQARKAEEIRDMLMREVAHRSKNMLAIVEAIVRQTARTPSVDIFASTLSGRLRSMAASQDLLFDSNWAGVDIMALARSQLDYANDPAAPRIEIEGPSLMLSPASAQALGMALHELSINALKFGALSSSQGSVRLRWSVLDETGRFVLIWTETGGPPVSAPVELGFGHLVLMRMTEASLQARAAIRYEPRGVEWSLEAPLGMVLAG